MNDLTTPSAVNASITPHRTIAQVAQSADSAAQRHVFSDYASRKAANTLTAQHADLITFAAFLASVGIDTDANVLMGNPESWTGITWGIVEGFQKAMLRDGFSIASVNRKLSTVKTYCKLAAKAGTLEQKTYAMIRLVAGYSSKEGHRVDEKREAARRGYKKADHVSISAEEAKSLKEQPDTPQGRRDGLLMAIMLDHGLRVGEVARLQVSDFDQAAGTVTFFRQKIDAWQTHRLTRHSAAALAAWIESGDAPNDGPLLRGSRKGGHLTAAGMSERAITARVRALGQSLGITGLSAHDCRHYWATRAAALGTDAFALRDAGGWASLAMPSRYVEASTIANERVRL